MGAGITVYNDSGSIQIDGEYSNLSVLETQYVTLDTITGPVPGGAHIAPTGNNYGNIYVHAKQIKLPSNTVIAAFLGLDSRYVYSANDVGKVSSTDSSDCFSLTAMWDNTQQPFPSTSGLPQAKLVFFGLSKNTSLAEKKYLQIFNEQEEQIFTASRPTLRVFNQILGNNTVFNTAPYTVASISKPVEKNIAICVSAHAAYRIFTYGQGIATYGHSFRFLNNSVDVIKYLNVWPHFIPFTASVNIPYYNYLFVDITGY